MSTTRIPTIQTINVSTRSGKLVPLTVDLPESSLQYTVNSSNTKTGPVITQFIGASRDESRATCTMCPLFEARECYSQFGTPAMGHASTLAAVKRGKDKSLATALSQNTAGKALRMAAIGDPASINQQVYEAHDSQAREAGLGVLSYTHQWHLPHAAWLKPLALASADTMADVNDAVGAGWRAALHVDEHDRAFDGRTIEEKPQGTLASGVKYTLCPAQRETRKPVQCNECQLCDRQKACKVDLIVFREHGTAMQAHKQQAIKAFGDRKQVF